MDPGGSGGLVSDASASVDFSALDLGGAFVSSVFNVSIGSIFLVEIPVLPNPLSPLVVCEMSDTSWSGSSLIRSKMICAMRSPLLISKVLFPSFWSMTLSSPV